MYGASCSRSQAQQCSQHLNFYLSFLCVFTHIQMHCMCVYVCVCYMYIRVVFVVAAGAVVIVDVRWQLWRLPLVSWRNL